MAALLMCTAVTARPTCPDMLAGNTVHLSVTVDPEGAGSVERSERDVIIHGNTTFTAKTNSGFSFNGWYVKGELVSSENPYQFMDVTEDMSIVAKFNVLEASILTCSVKPGCEGMGTVIVKPAGTVTGDSHKITTGETVVVTAVPSTGYQFDRWEDANGNVLSADAKYSFVLTEDCTLYAAFQKMENYKDDLAAFPGCEGYGRFTTGGRMIDGRGSKVYYVTRLDDCADDNLVEGTLRWALKTGDDTPRTILFKVSGTIYLTTRLMGAKANCTIAGQSAPGGGICIAGYQMKLGSNTIVRYIRFRAGDLPNKSMSMLDVENINHIVLDHCSFSWSMEENLTLYDTDYTTTQWCIFSEGLYNSRNSKGARSYAAQWGGEHGTLHHCLFASCFSRSPRFNGVRASTNDRHVDNEFVNNVIYNWGKRNSIYGGENDKSCNGYNRTYMINNYFRPGPATKNGLGSGQRWFVGASSSNGVGQWYLSGNKFEVDSKWAPSGNNWKKDVLEQVNADNLYGFISDASYKAINLEAVGNSKETYDKYILQSVVEWSGLEYESADEAYQKVVTQAGVSKPRYDEVDARILAEAAGTRDPEFGGSKGAKLGIIDSPYDITLSAHDDFVALYEGDDPADNKEIDVTCYPRLQMDADDCRVIDTDGDGLPDAYEDEVGLDKNNALDGQQLTVSGYSNLELFLNGVADGTIDATKYTKRQPVTKMNGFDAIVGEGGYSTVQEAVDAAPADATPYYIFVKAGTYEGHVQIDRQNIHLTGQSKHNTIITWNKLHNEDGGNVDNRATVNVTASDVSFDNLTIRNTRVNEGQALALYTKADRIVITSCNLEGWQDTYRTGKMGNRHLVRNCKISGTTDFIYGDGEVFFDNDTLLVLRSSNVIVAPDHNSPKYGYVFRDAVITAAQAGSKTHLGRPWGNTPKVSYINTRLSGDVTIPAEGWRDMGAYPLQMAEYNTIDAHGQAVDLSQRKTSFTVDGVTKGGSKAVLTPKEADSYKLDYMLRGTDEWDADWQAFILPAPQLFVDGTNVSWNDPTGYAQCYLVVADGVAMLTTATNADGSHVTVQSVSTYGVLGEQASSDNPTGVLQQRSSAEVVGRQFFTIDGRPASRLQHGVNVIRETLSDGTVRTTKVVVK